MNKLFDPQEQLQVVEENNHFIEMMCHSNNVQDWNERRQILKDEFIGLSQHKLMLLGYIDGVLFTWLRK